MVLTNYEILKIAARSYAGDDGAANLLHSDLARVLLDANDRVRRAKTNEFLGESLRSSQVIVGICIAWELAHPNDRAYG
jgi:hypothetical protein